MHFRSVFIPASLVVGVAIGFFLRPLLAPAVVRNISHVETTGGGVRLHAVAYVDGMTDLILRDHDSGWTTKTTTPAVWREKTGSYVTPRLTHRGDVWERAVFTYDSTIGDLCDNTIVYVKRPEKEFRITNTPYCIKKTLDGRDYTIFAGLSADGREIAVGKYEDGSIIDKKPVPEALVFSSIVTNWETTKAAVLFTDDRCRWGDSNCVPSKVMTWNFLTQSWTERELSKKSLQTSDLHFGYDKDSDRFNLELDFGIVQSFSPEP